MQLNELIRHIERDGIFLIRDYSCPDRDYNEIYERYTDFNFRRTYRFRSDS